MVFKVIFSLRNNRELDIRGICSDKLPLLFLIPWTLPKHNYIACLEMSRVVVPHLPRPLLCLFGLTVKQWPAWKHIILHCFPSFSLSLSPSSPSLSLRLPPFLFFLILLFLCLSTLGFLKPSYQRDMGRSYIFRYFQVPPTPALKPPQTEVKEIREERSLLNPAPIADLWIK